MKNKEFKEAIEELLSEGVPRGGKMKAIPRETNIVGYSIKYSDGSVKELDKAIIIYEDNNGVDMETARGVALEQNGGIGFTIQAFMCHSVNIKTAGLNAQKIMNDGLAMILGDGEKDE